MDRGHHQQACGTGLSSWLRSGRYRCHRLTTSTVVNRPSAPHFIEKKDRTRLRVSHSYLVRLPRWTNRYGESQIILGSGELWKEVRIGWNALFPSVRPGLATASCRRHFGSQLHPENAGIRHRIRHSITITAWADCSKSSKSSGTPRDQQKKNNNRYYYAILRFKRFSNLSISHSVFGLQARFQNSSTEQIF